MGLPKGRTNNASGRPKGSKNKRTLEWQALGEAIRDKHTTRFNQLLTDLWDDDDIKMRIKAAELYKDTLEYFEPKLSRQEVQQETINPTKIEIVRASDANSDK